MGANCCVAARNSKSSPTVTSIEVSTHRNIRYSPSWSFRWDNRTHIEDIVENHSRFSHGNSGNVGSEIKSGLDTETEGLSDGGSPLSSFQTPRWQKSPRLTRAAASSKSGETDASTGSNSSMEDNDLMKSSIKSSTSDPKPLTHAPPCLSTKADPSSSCSCSLPSETTSLRKARRSPGYQLSRQISDSRIPVLKSLNKNDSTEGRQSFVFPVCSSDLSNGGSSDGWSMRMFSELVASSQRDRWSFDSENLNFCHNKITRSNSQALVSPPPVDVQTCGVCSKLLKERSSWKSLELSVVAVLVCGHVYHAECLENVTSEIDRLDPSCPICTNGGKACSKLLKKAELKARGKISRIAVADVELDSGSSVEHRKGFEQDGKDPKMGASSSMKSSFSKPFLRRHFSIGSRTPSQSLLVNENTRKKGFWARYRRD